MQSVGRSVRVLIVLAIYFGLSECQSIGGDHYRSSPDRHNDDAAPERQHESVICMNVHPQRSLDMNQIMGVWYGNEIIIHSQDVPGVFSYDTCVIIEIANITDQMQNIYDNDFQRSALVHHQDPHLRPGQQSRQDFEPTRYLRFLWTERDDHLEYIFNYSTSSPGRWSNFGDQKGSLVILNHYTQFSGMVQVVKAVNNHLVLTFCGNGLKSTIYTVVLSRERSGLSKQELRSIRTMLLSRQLSANTIRRICLSGSTALSATLAFVLLSAIAVVLRKH